MAMPMGKVNPRYGSVLKKAFNEVLILALSL